MLKTLLSVFGYSLRHPGRALTSIANTMRHVDWQAHVQKKHDLQGGLPTVDILELFPDFNVEVAPYSYLEGSATVMDMALLKSLAASLPSCAYLEIGTWRGESLANVLPEADHCVSINLSDQQMLDRGLSPQFIRQINHYLDDSDKVKFIRANSATLDYSDFKRCFDLIFIDGDHSKKGVEADTANCFDLLRNDDSVIVWHDYGRTPESIRWSTVAGILDGAPADRHQHIYHVSNTLCALYTKRQLSASTQSFPVTPNKSFRVNVQAQKQ